MSEEQRLIAELLKRLAALEAEVERLKTENAELRRRLEKNSQNSHKPPSSDGYRKKSVQPGLPKREKQAPGGKPGHKGKTLRQVERPDKVQVHLPACCSSCGRTVSTEEKHIVVGKRQVFDLPEPKLEVIEHRLGQIECCGQAQTGQYPAYVTARVQYGPGVRALVTKYSVDHKMPLEQICGLFSDLYGYDLNSKTVENTLEQGYCLTAALEAAVMEALKHAAAVNFDETGLRVAGKLHWLHTAGNEHYTYLFVHAKRGKKALQGEKSVLKDFTGYAIHDCLAAYFSFSDAKHGLCNVHILRELQALIEDKSKWAQAMHELLLELHQELAGSTLSKQAAELLRERYRQILHQADEEEPPPKVKQGKGRPKNTPGRNLLRRLRQHEEAVLAFALVEGIPFTNNLAERDLRPAKVKQKVSGCFRTLLGAEVYARLQAIIATCRKQGRNIFATLRDIFSYQPVSLMAT
jgi:transposase